MVNWRWAINVYLAINYWKSLHNQCPACSRLMITKILSQNCDCHKNVTAATKTNRKLLSGLVWCGLWIMEQKKKTGRKQWFVLEVVAAVIKVLLLFGINSIEFCILGKYFIASLSNWILVFGHLWTTPHEDDTMLRQSNGVVGTKEEEKVYHVTCLKFLGWDFYFDTSFVIGGIDSVQWWRFGKGNMLRSTSSGWAVAVMIPSLNFYQTVHSMW